jgi:ATP-binding cassette subfamily F protein uup
MSLITATQLHLAFGHVDLLDRTDFSLEENERVGLIGRNGTGKSSLLKILAGLQTADDGLLQQQRDLKVAYVPQEPELDASLTIAQSVRLGLRKVDEMLEQLSTCQDPDQLHELHTHIEMANGWNLDGRVDETLSRANVWHWHKPWCCPPMCCCWTSPPTTWIWKPSAGWKNCSFNSGAV